MRVDYLRIVDADTLKDLADVRSGALMAAAAWVGATRLIDNVVIGDVRIENVKIEPR